MIELDLFADLHGVTAGTDPNPEAPRSNICRLCAAEVLLWGLREWWVRERQKGFLEATVMSRNDCPDGSACNRQRDLGMFLLLRDAGISLILHSSAHSRECTHSSLLC